MGDLFLTYVQDRPDEKGRYLLLKQTLASFRKVFRGRRVLDFGASQSLSMCVLLELGAAEVVGVEPDEARVRRGIEILASVGYGARARLHRIVDTSHLPFADASFEFVLANAVLEHIPEPRGCYVRELWRVLAPGGHLLVNETPNKYLPWDYHTTGLFFVPWLPGSIARRYAILRGRFREEADWASSGWRGLGYYELIAALDGAYEVITERSRVRHRLLARLGLPSSLLDPYPTILIKKPCRKEAPPSESAN